jgi:hypothetical protein
MKLLSFRTAIALTITAGGAALPLIASCGNSNPPAVEQSGSSGSSGFGGSGGSNGSGASGGSGNSGQASGGSSGASGDMDSGLVTYDGPPSKVDGGLLSCATPDGLPIKFNPMYSGFDGTHIYEIPTFVVGVDPATVTWGSSDPSMIDLQPYVRGIMVTTRKAGDVTLVATIGTKCGSALLHITQYTVDQWKLGSDRYNNGNALVFTLPDGAIINLPDAAGFDAAMFEGGFPDVDLPDTFVNPFENPAAACTNCHGDTGNGKIFQDISHTPEQTGGFSEAELTNCFLHGTIPDGGYYDPTIFNYKYWHQLHTWWDIDTPDKQVGMNAYLRSLTPKEQTGCFELFNSHPCDAGTTD